MLARGLLLSGLGVILRVILDAIGGPVHRCLPDWYPTGAKAEGAMFYPITSRAGRQRKGWLRAFGRTDGGTRERQMGPVSTRDKAIGRD